MSATKSNAVAHAANDSDHATTVCVLLTTFNRRELTLACLGRLAEAAQVADVELYGVLVDDGSSDGTAHAAKEAFPWLTVLHGDGGLFWNRGMHMAMTYAFEHVPAEYYLWLNDDTLLFQDALNHLLATAMAVLTNTGRAGVVVGSTCNAGGDYRTYGGLKRAGKMKSLSFVAVYSATEYLPCDTMNGNVVLIPQGMRKSLGPLDPMFEHGMGDIDYGLRATGAGHPIVVASGYVGICEKNTSVASFRDGRISLRQRFRNLNHRKGLPWRSWLQLTRRHAGWAWPLYFSLPYYRALLAGFSFSRRNSREASFNPPREH